MRKRGDNFKARYKFRLGQSPLWFVVGLVLTANALAKPPDFPPPPKANVVSVGQDMVINGRVTSIRTFTADQDIEEIFDFYRDIWSEPVARGGPNYAQEDVALAPWRVLTRVEDGYAMTVQAQGDEQGTRGYLAISALPSGPDEDLREAPPPSPRGTEILSNISHQDPGLKGQTTVMKNDFPVTQNVDFYRDKYADWRVDMDRAVAEGRVHALRFTRGKRNVIITINGDDGGSEIVVNRVQRHLL